MGSWEHKPVFLLWYGEMFKVCVHGKYTTVLSERIIANSFNFTKFTSVSFDTDVSSCCFGGSMFRFWEWKKKQKHLIYVLMILRLDPPDSWRKTWVSEASLWAWSWEGSRPRDNLTSREENQLWKRHIARTWINNELKISLDNYNHHERIH